MVHGVPLKLIALIGACALLTTPAVAGAYVETPKYVGEVNKRENEEAIRKQKAVEEQEQKAAEEHKAAEEREAAEGRSQWEAAERRYQKTFQQNAVIRPRMIGPTEWLGDLRNRP